jgi:hypothetical protein
MSLARMCVSMVGRLPDSPVKAGKSRATLSISVMFAKLEPSLLWENPSQDLGSPAEVGRGFLFATPAPHKR